MYETTRKLILGIDKETPPFGGQARHRLTAIWKKLQFSIPHPFLPYSYFFSIILDRRQIISGRSLDVGCIGQLI